MAEGQRMTAAERERLRQEWMQRAEQAFERMFAAELQAELVSFTQREDRAVDLGQELARWLIEEHTAVDPAAQPSAARAGAEGGGDGPDISCCRCPKCGKPARALTKPADPLPERQLLSRAGPVRLEREQYRCTTCRVVFFPLGREAGVECGGLQSAGPANAGAPGGQGRQLRRRLR